MTSWLDPVRAALDGASHIVPWFFRDDDAGWDDDALRALLDVFARHTVPVDVAVIPAALHDGLAAELQRRAESQPLGLHQHGFAHTNHEPANQRKCEFGPSRSRAEQRADLEAGRRRIADAFGSADVFVPPWNRITDDTIECLVELRYALLSRDRGATPPNDAVPEVQVTVDWMKDPSRVPTAITDSLGRDRVVGVMLHHAVMRDELERLDDLLAFVASHPRVRCGLLRDVAQA